MKINPQRGKFLRILGGAASRGLAPVEAISDAPISLGR